MPPKNSHAKPMADALADGSDPAGKKSPGKGKEIIDNIPSEAESSSRIDRALVSQSLLLHVEFVTPIMPADPISDHSFADKRKRVKATTVHLQQAVAALKQAWLGDLGNEWLKALLDEKESQLRGYQLARQERLHMMAGMYKAVTGEVASPFLSGKIKARREKTQIKELSAGRATVTDNKAILGVAGRLTAAWSKKEVKSAFHAMAKNKAPGSDGLPKELFEEHWDVLGKHFMALVESFTESAVLPASTKSAITILLHKKSGRDAVENYRPLTLLSFTYKVLARVVADRMKGVLNEVISPEQYGFLPGRRLSDAVGLVAGVIEAAKNENAEWYLLLVGFKKAFDSLSRNYLFSVLERMGFPSKFVGWIKGLDEDTQTRLLVNG
ncbi:unnamed protein product [Closterium sp. Yama58-4]|nr:unnamed protein product [Closterium sp. Yama58-4]